MYNSIQMTKEDKLRLQKSGFITKTEVLYNLVYRVVGRSDSVILEKKEIALFKWKKSELKRGGMYNT